jgi:succinoglycan biosynthesis transport protein ExoP
VADRTSSDDLRGLLAVLKRRAPVILACVVLVPLAALGFSLLQDKQYSASALLLFRDPAFDQQLFGSSVLPQSGDADREAATNIRLVSARGVADRAAASDKVQQLRPDVTGADVAEMIKARPQGQADIAAVTATDSDPQFSALLANVFAREFIVYRRDTDRATIEGARRLVERQLQNLVDEGVSTASRRESLEQRAEELGILASLQTGNAELVQRASVPTTPSAPRTKRNVAVGVVFGLLLGLGLAFLIERFDRRFRDTKDMEETFERPILALVPQIRRGSGRRTGGDGLDLEAFRMLRANLRYFNLDRQIQSLLVTSAAPGDGKTTVSHNLAAAAAEAGDRVLLIEADLRRPTLAQRLEQRPDRPGLTTLIASKLPLHHAVQPVALSTWLSNVSSDASLDVLFAGPQPPNPIDLLESERMREIIRDAEDEYDLVIVDTPPTSVVSDAIPLVKLVSGVIVVSRLGRSTRDAARRLREQLELLDAPVLGVVANFVPSAPGYYGYYGYGSTGEPSVEQRKEPAGSA